MLATLVFLSVSMMLPMLPSLLPDKLRRWTRGVPAAPMLWLRGWNCDLRTDWLLLQLCLLLVDFLECSGMELKDDVVNKGGLWVFVGLFGWVSSAVVREGWNMDREWTRDLLCIDMVGQSIQNYILCSRNRL